MNLFFTLVCFFSWDNFNLPEEKEKWEMGNILYREAAGSLLYNSQEIPPDILYAVGLPSQFANNPFDTYCDAV